MSLLPGRRIENGGLHPVTRQQLNVLKLSFGELRVLCGIRP